MTSSETGNTKIQKKTKRYLVASMVGHSIAETLTTPLRVTMEVYRTTDMDLTSSLKSISSRRGFFNGLVPALASKTISSPLKFFLYQYFKKRNGTENGDLKSNVKNGMLGGVIGTVLTNPLSVWRMKRSRGEVMRLEFAWKGLGMSVLRCIPFYSLIYPTRDFYKHHFKAYGTSGVPNVITASILPSLCATMTTSLLVYPIELSRALKQAEEPLPSFRRPFKWYRGFGLAFLRNAPHFIIAMYTIDWIMDELH